MNQFVPIVVRAFNSVFNYGTIMQWISFRLCLSQDDLNKLIDFTKSHTHSSSCFGSMKWNPLNGKCLSFEVGSYKRCLENGHWPFQMSTQSILQLESCHLAREIVFPFEPQFMTGDLFPAPMDSVQDTEAYENVFFSIGTLIGFCLKHSIPAELPLHPLFIDLIRHGYSEITNLNDGFVSPFSQQ